MIFLYPEALWLLAAAPAACAAYVVLVRRRMHGALAYPSLAVVRLAVARGHPIRRHIAAVLFFIAFLVLLLACARPAFVALSSGEPELLMLSIDVSYSMAATDVAPSRLEAVQTASKNLIRKKRPGTKVGIVAFGGYADVVQAPTTDPDSATAAIDQLGFKFGSALGTAVFATLSTIFPDTPMGIAYDLFGTGRSPADLGLARARSKLKDGSTVQERQSVASAAIILLSDGQTTTGAPLREALKLSAGFGIPVYTIAVGTPNARSVAIDGWNFDPGYEPEALRKIAMLTRGEHFRATSSEGLRLACETLVKRLRLTSEDDDVTVFFVAVAAALLLASASVSMLWSIRA